jgi:hypothetical protein
VRDHLTNLVLGVKAPAVELKLFRMKKSENYVYYFHKSNILVENMSALIHFN